MYACELPRNSGLKGLVPMSDVELLFVFANYYASEHYKYCVSFAKKSAFGDKDRAHDLLVDHLVLVWDKIVRSWDKNLSPFPQWVYNSFRFNVLRKIHEDKRRLSNPKLTAEQCSLMNPQSLSTITNLYTDTPTCQLVAKEDRIGEDYTELLSKLPELHPDLSFILWNYAHGVTLEMIGNHLGVSKVTMTGKLRGAIEALRRVANVDEVV